MNPLRARGARASVRIAGVLRPSNLYCEHLRFAARGISPLSVWMAFSTPADAGAQDSDADACLGLSPESRDRGGFAMFADISCAGFIVMLCSEPGLMSKRSYGRRASCPDSTAFSGCQDPVRRPAAAIHEAGCRTDIWLLLRYRLFMTSSGSTLSSRERRRPELR
jgi:hypothetical protein